MDPACLILPYAAYLLPVGYSYETFTEVLGEGQRVSPTCFYISYGPWWPDRGTLVLRSTHLLWPLQMVFTWQNLGTWVPKPTNLLRLLQGVLPLNFFLLSFVGNATGKVIHFRINNALSGILISFKQQCLFQLISYIFFFKGKNCLGFINCWVFILYLLGGGVGFRFAKICWPAHPQSKDARLGIRGFPVEINRDSSSVWKARVEFETGHRRILMAQDLLYLSNST